MSYFFSFVLSFQYIRLLFNIINISYLYISIKCPIHAYIWRIHVVIIFSIIFLLHHFFVVVVLWSSFNDCLMKMPSMRSHSFYGHHHHFILIFSFCYCFYPSPLLFKSISFDTGEASFAIFLFWGLHFILLLVFVTLASSSFFA